MTSSSTYIFLHISCGECVGILLMIRLYVTKVTSGRLIAKETTYEEIKRLVKEELWHENEGFKMKFKDSYAEDILLNLVDDVVVAQLINYNNTIGHVCMCKYSTHYIFLEWVATLLVVI